LNYKRGDKVEIKSKSTWCQLENSRIYNRGKDQGYWYFTGYFNDLVRRNICVVSNILNDKHGGDYFLECDIAHYKDKLMIPKIKGELFEL